MLVDATQALKMLKLKTCNKLRFRLGSNYTAGDCSRNCFFLCCKKIDGAVSALLSLICNPNGWQRACLLFVDSKKQAKEMNNGA